MKDAVTELAMIVVFSIIMSLFIKDQEVKTSYYVFLLLFQAPVCNRIGAFKPIRMEALYIIVQWGEVLIAGTLFVYCAYKK